MKHLELSERQRELLLKTLEIYISTGAPVGSYALSEELEAALPAYPGAVVVASHDTWLASRWTGTHLDIPSRT